MKPLPRLTTIRIIADIFEPDTFKGLEVLPLDFTAAMVEMLEQRLDESTPTFVLETTTTRFGRTTDTEARVKELTSKGYVVEITENFYEEEEDFLDDDDNNYDDDDDDDDDGDDDDDSN